MRAEQTYWWKKVTFIASHRTTQDAQREIMALVAKCPMVDHVDPRPEEAAVTVHRTNGKSFVYDYSQDESPHRMTHAEALEGVNLGMDNLAHTLAAGALMGIETSGGVWQINPDKLQRFCDILLAPLSPTEMQQRLIDGGFVKAIDTHLLTLLSTFQADGDEIYLRFGKVPPSYAGTPAVTGQRFPGTASHPDSATAAPADADASTRCGYAQPLIIVVLITAALTALVLTMRSVRRRIKR
jgi:hypothetical protein